MRTLDEYEAAITDPTQTREQEIEAHNEQMRKLKPTGDAYKARLVAARLQVRRDHDGH